MKDQREEDIVEIDLLEIFQVLIGRIWLIICAGLLVAGVCFAISRYVIAPVYESTTKIYILNKSENTGITYSDVQMGTQLTKDYAELISSRYVLEQVIGQLSFRLEYDDLLHMVSVSTPSDTRIVAITVKDTDPVKAMNIANLVREVASEHIQNVMDIDAVNIVEEANMPTKKAGPSCVKWTLLGGLVGCMLSAAVILVRHLLDDTIKSSEDVEKYLGLSTLALIPIAESGNGRKKKKKKKKRK